MKTLTQTRIPEIKTTINYYSFNTNNTIEAAEYQALRDKLEATYGSKFFNAICRSQYAWSGDKAQPITLYTSDVFDNQWNSDKGRVFDWMEDISPSNRHAKKGHYLTLVPEMDELRSKIYKCRYCGKYSDEPGIHVEDLGSEYLKRDQIHIARFMLFTDKEIPVLTQDSHYLDLYDEVQRNRLKKKGEQTKARLLQELENTNKAIETKIDGLVRLLDAGIDTENVTYYPHVNTFTFGWRNSLDAGEKLSLETRVKAINFPYIVEYKTHGV